MVINTLEQFRKERASRTKDSINCFNNKKTDLPSLPISIWRNNKGGWLTHELFYELHTPYSGYKRKLSKEKMIEEMVIRRLGSPYTTADDDLIIKYEGTEYIYTSLKKLYIQYDHLPGYEYEFALVHLGGWEHWLALKENTKTKDIILAWEKEKLIEIKSRSMNRILEMSKGSTKDSFQAAKFLATKGYDVDKSPAQNKKITKEINSEVDKDLERLGLRLVK